MSKSTHTYASSELKKIIYKPQQQPHPPISFKPLQASLRLAKSQMQQAEFIKTRQKCSTFFQTLALKIGGADNETK